MSKRLKIILIMLLAATLVFFTAGGIMLVSAEEVTVPPEQEETAEPEDTETDSESAGTIEDVAADFVGWLKDTFGEDYEKYYNNIITNWGSIEEYLLQFGQENIPEQYQTGWQNFVKALGENAPFWAPILAVAIVIIVYLIGKKRFTAIIQKAVDGKTAAMGKELNKQSKALTSVIHSQKAMLGNNAKFADTIKDLDESEKELNS